MPSANYSSNLLLHCFSLILNKWGLYLPWGKDLSDKCSEKKSWQILHEWVTNDFLHFANYETVLNKGWQWAGLLQTWCVFPNGDKFKRRQCEQLPGK